MTTVSETTNVKLVRDHAKQITAINVLQAVPTRIRIFGQLGEDGETLISVFVEDPHEAAN